MFMHFSAIHTIDEMLSFCRAAKRLIIKSSLFFCFQDVEGDTALHYAAFG